MISISFSIIYYAGMINIFQEWISLVQLSLHQVIYYLVNNFWKIDRSGNRHKSNGHIISLLYHFEAVVINHSKECSSLSVSVQFVAFHVLANHCPLDNNDA